MAKLNFSAQTARRRPIHPVPEKFEESQLRPNILEGDGIRPHFPLVPLRYLDVKFQDKTTDLWVVIPKGRLVSAVTVQNNTTGDILKIGNTFSIDEVLGAGDGLATAFSGNLSHSNVVAGSVKITDGFETFTDDGAGNLTGSAGGSGTINYTTGAYSVTFNAAVGNGTYVTATYKYVPDDKVYVGVVDQTDGSTPLYIGADDSYYAYTRDINGLLVPANGGVNRVITYDADDVAAGVPSASGNKTVVGIGDTYTIPANMPIGVAMYDVYQDIRGSYLNYEMFRSYGIVAEQYIKIPFVDFGILRAFDSNINFVDEDGGSTKSGYKVGAATIDAVKDAGYLAAEEKYSFVYFDSTQHASAGLSGQLFQPDLFGNWVPQGAAVDGSSQISLTSSRNIQTAGRLIYVDTRFPKDLLDVVETPYGERVSGTGTAGVPFHLFDFAYTVLTAGGYNFGTVDPAKAILEMIQAGAFGEAYIQLMLK